MKPWAKALISAALLALIFLVLPWPQVREAVGRLPPVIWLGVLAGFVAGHAIGIAKWRLFVNAARARLSRVDATMCYSAGLFANLCLPTIVGGDLLRIGLAAKLTKRPVAALWGGVMDRMTDMGALAILMTAGGLLARRGLEGWAAQALTVALVVGTCALLLALPIVLRRPIAGWPPPFRRHIARGFVGIRQISRRPGAAATGMALSLMVQGGFVLLNAWLGHVIGIDVSLAVWFLVWPLAKIAALIPISLGGLAVREASLAALLLPFGIPAALSVVCSLLWQTVNITGGLLGGLVWLILHRSRHIAFRAQHGRVVITEPAPR